MLRLLPHLKHVHNSGFLSHCLTPVPNFPLPLPHIGQINPFDLSLVKKENGALFIASCISLFVIVNLIQPFFFKLMYYYRRLFQFFHFTILSIGGGDACGAAKRYRIYRVYTVFLRRQKCCHDGLKPY